MATGSMNSSVARQSHLFLALLILLWGLIICFVGYQYTREREHKIALLNSSLQIINFQMGDDISNGVTPQQFFKRNHDRIKGLRIVIMDSEGYITYSSDSKCADAPTYETIEEIISMGSASIVKQLYGDQQYIYSATRYKDMIICSSLPYNLPVKDIFKGSSAFLVIAIVISMLISIIGFITSKLYLSLEETTAERDREHESALREEQDKIRLKRQLTNNINHELKTPVCSILGYMEMILNTPNLDPEMCRSFVSKSYDQAERLRHLMSDLTTITRIDEASAYIDLEQVDIQKMTNDIIDDVLPQLVAQNINIKSNIDKPIIVLGNHSLLYSIFRNLVDNAIAYSGGRCIWIDLLRESSDTYYFSVRDNGIGVEAKHLPYLFERFYRVDKGRSRKLGGTGLGLSIVKNAVVFHGGTINARLEEWGGLDFIFSLKKEIQRDQNEGSTLSETI